MSDTTFTNAIFTNLTVRSDTADAVGNLLTLDAVDANDGNGAALSFINNSTTNERFMALGRISAWRVNASTVRLDFGVARDASISTGDEVAQLLSLVSDKDGLSVATAEKSTLAVAGALKVSGVATLKSMTVTGRATLGTLRLTGSAILNTTLAVAGAATLGSLSVGGAASLGGTLKVAGATALGGSLSVGGASSLNSVRVGGTISVAGATALDDSLSVGGAASLNSVRVGGTTILDDSLNVGGNATFSGSIGVGTTDPRSALDIAGTININPAVNDFAQNGIHFDSGFGNTALFLHRYGEGYAYQDLAIDHNLFPRVAFGVEQEHLFIGTRTAHELVLSTSDHPRIVVGADGNVGIGTVSPINRLHIFNAGPGLTIDGDQFPGFRMAVNGSTAAIAQIRTDEGNNLDFGSSGPAAVKFLTNSQLRMRITSAGKVVISKSQDDAELEIQGTVRAATFEGNGIIPRGVVVLWSGQINALPSGWAICDGGNGTPDLRDQFIVGAGRAYGVGATGGEALHRLTVDELPSHNHDNGIWRLLVNNAGNGTSQRTDYTPGEVNIIDARSIQPVGGDRPHENRPPYYALAFIMKL
jgi:hypothetical protein